ncbi:outer membrane protein [Roseibium sp. TrichSKD4]|uniref:outer membrane protein n=1 Tax=Roseibium sp. TrichSKD4 TaxID=744980 RepID=UPI00143A5A85|nr:outer membrane protein [Roseibium sp. TrichSKD4]
MFLKRLSLAGAAAVMSTAAIAADLPAPIIEHVPEIPAPAAVGGGFYLRGDIGYKIYGDPTQEYSDTTLGDIRYDRESLDDTWMIGVGVGYKFNKYFRTDLTIDYEAAAEAVGYVECAHPCGSTSRDTADIDVWTVMLNGYVDLATWNKITPYVGAGIGAAYVNTSDFYSGSPTTPYQFDGSNGEWNFAWALMAGASYAVTNNFAIDAGYRYKDLGEAKTTILHNVGSKDSRMEYKDLTAHEFRLGARYTFGGGAAAAPAYYPSGPISSNF